MQVCKFLVSAILVLIAVPSVMLSSPQQDQEKKQDDKPVAVTSRLETAENGDVFLTQEAIIEAPIKKVWDAYTTSKGWSSWIAPVAEVDFKIGGTIRTNYDKEGTVTDEGANVLHIINYVPERVLTLQAQVTKNWPEILKEQEKRLFNVICFEKISDKKTKIISHGIGYRDTPELQKLLKFFVPANEGTLRKLKAYVEKGKHAFDEAK